MLKEIVFKTLEEAESVLKYLREVISANGYATAYHYYTAAGIDADIGDEEYVWVDLTGVTIQPGTETYYIDSGTQEVVMGYIITLPEPVLID